MTRQRVSAAAPGLESGLWRLESRDSEIGPNILLLLLGQARPATERSLIEFCYHLLKTSTITKLKPRWDVHSRGDEDWLGCASEAISSVLGE